MTKSLEVLRGEDILVTQTTAIHARDDRYHFVKRDMSNPWPQLQPPSQYQGGLLRPIDLHVPFRTPRLGYNAPPFVRPIHSHPKSQRFKKCKRKTIEFYPISKEEVLETKRTYQDVELKKKQLNIPVCILTKQAHEL